MTGEERGSQEWEPQVGDEVIDRRLHEGFGGEREARGASGVVVECRKFGHGADSYWLASVSWADEDGHEHNINTIWLARPDGSQGPRG